MEANRRHIRYAAEAEAEAAEKKAHEMAEAEKRVERQAGARWDEEEHGVGGNGGPGGLVANGPHPPGKLFPPWSNDHPARAHPEAGNAAGAVLIRPLADACFDQAGGASAARVPPRLITAAKNLPLKGWGEGAGAALSELLMKQNDHALDASRYALHAALGQSRATDSWMELYLNRRR
jgi:hypothetical protein